MNKIEAEKYLNNHGPWEIKIYDYSIRFENEKKEVLWMNLFIDAPFVGVPGVIVQEFTLS
jgi:hypothetical protein